VSRIPFPDLADVLKRTTELIKIVPLDLLRSAGNAQHDLGSGDRPEKEGSTPRKPKNQYLKNPDKRKKIRPTKKALPKPEASAPSQPNETETEGQGPSENQ
jgi:hypothetical protein